MVAESKYKTRGKLKNVTRENCRASATE